MVRDRVNSFIHRDDVRAAGTAIKGTVVNDLGKGCSEGCMQYARVHVFTKRMLNSQ